MAYDGTMKFDTSLDASGFQKGANSLTSLVKGLGVFEILKKGFQAIADSVGAAVEQYDTLNRFPRVLDQMGYSATDAEAATSRLSQGIQGLPTTLSDVVGTAQSLTQITGDLSGSVETTLALNNAFLASGASAGDASRGLLQYTQMLSSGKVDMMSWRTLQETMPVALQKTAEAFGFTGSSAKNDLYAALRDGEITFQQFNDKIIELNGGVGGFAEMAQAASGGIGTAWSTLQTAIVTGTAGIIAAIDEGLSETRFQSIETVINTMKDGIVLALGLVADAFGFVAENIETILVVIATLAVAITTLKFLSLVSAMGGVSGAIAAMLPKFALLIAAKIKDAAVMTVLYASYLKDTIAKGSMAAATAIATVAQKAFGVALNASMIQITLIIAAVMLVVAGIIALVAILGKSTSAHDKEVKAIKKATDAQKDYNKSIDEHIEETRAASTEKSAAIRVNEQIASSLKNLIAANDEHGNNNYAIAASVNMLNESMEGLGLAYDSTTGKLNMTDAELQTYIKNLQSVTEYQEKQEEYNRLLQETARINQEIDAVKAQQGVYDAQLAAEIITQEEYNSAIEATEARINELRVTRNEYAAAAREAGEIAAAAYDVEAEAGVRRQQIMNNEMGQVEEYAKMWGMTADEVIDQASRLGGGLTELASANSDLTDSYVAEQERIARAAKVAQDDLVEDIKDGNIEISDSYGQLLEDRRRNGEELSAVDQAGLDAWKARKKEEQELLEEYAESYGMTVDEVKTALEAINGDHEAFVAEQERLLRKAAVEEENYVDAIKNGEVEISEAVAKAYELRLQYGGELSATEQAYLDKYKSNIAEQEALIEEYAEKYGIAADQIVAEYQSMEGGLEAWAAKAEQEHRAALAAEQDYIEQIKAGNVEIEASYAQSLEARRVNGEELNAIEQATLDQWKAMNQAAVEAYKAQQQEIIDASKAKASEIKLSDQQSANEVLEIQRKNNEATAQYVQNYNTIWGQIPESQRGYLAELDMDSARFLQEMVAKWDKGGKEQWEQYVAGIEEGKTNASQLAGDAAVEVGDALIAGAESKEPEIKEAGEGTVDAYDDGAKDAAATSEAGQAIADAVVEDLTNADFSGITAAIATAITSGTNAVVTAAKTMSDNVLAAIETMKIGAKTKVAVMMINASTEITTRSATVKSAAKTTGDAVVGEFTSMSTSSISIVTLMMADMNSTIIVYASVIQSSATSTANGAVLGFEPMVAGAVAVTNRMMEGMLTAMNNKAADLYAKAEEIANNIAAKLAAALEVKSPSRVMIDIFENVMMGIYVGMENMEGALYDKADDIADNLAQHLLISPDVSALMNDQLRAIVEADPFNANHSITESTEAGGAGGPTYITNLYQTITSPEPISPSDASMEAEAFLRRSKHQIP